MKQLYALVEWLVPAKTYTAGILIEWVRDYDIKKYKETLIVDSEESYFIEWRDGKKKRSQKGWPVYDGIIRAISSKNK